MSVVKAALTLTMVVAFSVSCLADDRFMRKEIGQEYAKFRNNLLVAGYIPLDQTKDPNRFPLDDPEVYSMYPELSNCAIDQQAPRRFEWETKDRHRFYIITTGEDVHHLRVAGSGDE